MSEPCPITTCTAPKYRCKKVREGMFIFCWWTYFLKKYFFQKNKLSRILILSVIACKSVFNFGFLN